MRGHKEPVHTVGPYILVRVLQRVYSCPGEDVGDFPRLKVAEIGIAPVLQLRALRDIEQRGVAASGNRIKAPVGVHTRHSSFSAHESLSVAHAPAGSAVVINAAPRDGKLCALRLQLCYRELVAFKVAEYKTLDVPDPVEAHAVPELRIFVGVQRQVPGRDASADVRAGYGSGTGRVCFSRYTLDFTYMEKAQHGAAYLGARGHGYAGQRGQYEYGGKRSGQRAFQGTGAAAGTPIEVGGDVLPEGGAGDEAVNGRPVIVPGHSSPSILSLSMSRPRFMRILTALRPRPSISAISATE